MLGSGCSRFLALVELNAGQSERHIVCAWREKDAKRNVTQNVKIANDEDDMVILSR
jgi:hypothetical protein